MTSGGGNSNAACAVWNNKLQSTRWIAVFVGTDSRCVDIIQARRTPLASLTRPGAATARRDVHIAGGAAESRTSRAFASRSRGRSAAHV